MSVQTALDILCSRIRKLTQLGVSRATACWSELVLEKNLGQNLVNKVLAGHSEDRRRLGGGAGRAYYLSAQRSWADCRLMPIARPMSAQEASAAFAAATGLSYPLASQGIPSKPLC